MKAAAMMASSPEVTKAAQMERTKVGRQAAKDTFRAFVDAQRPRWQQEAAQGIALIHSLAVQQQEAA